MKAFKIKYADGSYKIVTGPITALDVIKRFDLATRKHVNTRVIELDGEQLAIALANEADN